MIEKEDVPVDWRMSLSQVSSLRHLPAYIVRMAKAMAYSMGEECPDAYYYYMGEALVYCADHIDAAYDSPAWREALNTLIQELRS